MSPPRRAAPSSCPLYVNGTPTADFNSLVQGWLRDDIRVREHKPPAAFGKLRHAYEGRLAQLSHNPRQWENHRVLLSDLTNVMLGINLAPSISDRLESSTINEGGFRTALAQGVAKNSGENFVNMIVYALADSLAHQDEVLVDKGLPAPLKEALTLRRTFAGAGEGRQELTIPIESDFCVFARSNPRNAIIGSAKTRLKEVFHIGTMWKLFFDMLDDPHCLQKWSLETSDTTCSPPRDMEYIFATADMVPPGGQRSQGGDVEREEPRNLIKVDASFFDYVFVSKRGISHVSESLNLQNGREALFHELGCLFDLIEQKFQPLGFSFG